jgi:hypothetical protein
MDDYTVITREEWDALLEQARSKDAGLAQQLEETLDMFIGGNTCPLIEVNLNSLGQLESTSDPMPHRN